LVLIYTHHFDKSKYYRHFNSILTYQAINRQLTLIDVNSLAYVRKKLYSVPRRGLFGVLPVLRGGIVAMIYAFAFVNRINL